MERKLDLESNLRLVLIVLGVLLAALALLVGERVLRRLGWYHSAPAFSVDEMQQTYDATMKRYADLRKRSAAWWHEREARPDALGALSVRVRRMVQQGSQCFLIWLRQQLDAWAPPSGASMSV